MLAVRSIRAPDKFGTERMQKAKGVGALDGRGSARLTNAQQPLEICPNGAEAPPRNQASDRPLSAPGLRRHGEPERLLAQPTRLASTIDAPLGEKRAVRRRQLRQMVPLADTTIYEMEQRGEFPRRFYLTSRCVAWDAAEIEAWLEERRRTSSAHMSKRVSSPDVRKRTSRPVRR
jgi:prophage regulatory protein